MLKPESQYVFASLESFRKAEETKDLNTESASFRSF